MIPCSVLFSSSISCRAHDIHFTASKYYIHIMNNYTDYDLNEYESLPAKGKEKMVRQISSQTMYWDSKYSDSDSELVAQVTR